jgi:hypothetical protein
MPNEGSNFLSYTKNQYSSLYFPNFRDKINHKISHDQSAMSLMGKSNSNVLFQLQQDQTMQLPSKIFPATPRVTNFNKSQSAFLLFEK